MIEGEGVCLIEEDCPKLSNVFGTFSGTGKAVIMLIS